MEVSLNADHQTFLFNDSRWSCSQSYHQAKRDLPNLPQLQELKP